VLSFLRADLKDEKYRAMEKAGWGVCGLYDQIFTRTPKAKKTPSG